MNVQQAVLVLVCFGGGYIVVSQLWAAWSQKRRMISDRPADESYYRRVLGVGPDADADSLRLAYATRIDKYDPAKFADFGPEFEELAIERTKVILAAYEYLTRSRHA